MKERALSLSYRILGVGLKQFTNIAIFFTAARLLSVEDFGIYNYVLAFALLFATLCDFGISTAVSKYIAKAVALGNNISGIIVGSVLSIVVVLGAVLSLILFSLHNLVRIDVSFLLPLTLLIFLVPIFAVFDGIYRGEQDAKALALASISGVLPVVIFGYYLISSFGVSGALFAQLIFYIGGISMFLFRYKRPIFHISKTIIKDVTRISIPLGMIALVYFMYARVDIVILGLLGYTLEVGYFEIVNKVLLLLSLPIQIYSQIESPRVVALWHTTRGKVYKLLRQHILFGVPLFTAVAFASYIIVPLLINSFFVEYSNSTVFSVLFIMLFIYVFQGTSDLVGNTFTVSTDHEKFNLKIMAIFALLNLIFVYIGVSIFGPIGLAYAKVLVYVPYSLLFVLLYSRKLKVAPSIDIKTSEA